MKEAEGLSLPKYFYNYLKKETCPGCRGCDDDFEFPPDYGKDKKENENSFMSIEPDPKDKPAHDDNKDKRNKSSFHSASSGSSFGAVPSVSEASSTAGLFSSAAVGFSSFSDIASGAERPSNFVKDEGFKFSGAGAQLFSSGGGEGGEEEGNENPEEEANIHFKPIVTLPESYDYKSTEKEGETLFDECGKLYRFDGSTNQWKERGVGNMKIIYHHRNRQTRLVMRRDQILKLCCNHYITDGMSIQMQMGNPKAMTWFTETDYSEETALPQKLALRFKHEETAKRFKDLFEEAVSKAKEVSNMNDENEEEREEEEEEEEEGQDSESDDNDDSLWTCPDCSVKNDISTNECVTCEAPRPISSSLDGAVSSTPSFGVSSIRYTPSSLTPSFAASRGPHTIHYGAPPPVSISGTTAVHSSSSTGALPPSFQFGNKTAPGSAVPSFVGGPSAQVGRLKLPASTRAPLPQYSSYSAGPMQTSFPSVTPPVSAMSATPPRLPFQLSSTPQFKGVPSTSVPQLGATQPEISSGPVSLLGPGPSTLPPTFMGGLGTASSTVPSFVMPQSSVAPSFAPLRGNVNKILLYCFIHMNINSVTFSFFIGPTIAAVTSTPPITRSLFLTNTTTVSQFTHLFSTGSAVSQFNAVSTTSSVFTLSSPAQVSFATSTTKPFFTAPPTSIASKGLLSGNFVPATNAMATTTSTSMPSLFNTAVTTPSLLGSTFSSTSASVTNKPLPLLLSNTPAKSEGDEEEEVAPSPDVSFEFTPLVSLPEIEDLTSGEENEDVLFSETGKLYRFDSTPKQWKERGKGVIKILKHKLKGKSRILMRREQILKICCNHFITSDMCMSPFGTTQKSMMWYTLSDFSDEVCKPEKLVIRFKSIGMANDFKEAFEKCVKETKLVDAKPPPSLSPSLPPLTSSTSQTSVKPLTVQSAPGQWECSVCYVSNKPEAVKCVACETSRGGGISSTLSLPSLSSFKAPGPLKSTPGTQLKPLASLSSKGDWECSACYVSNKTDAVYCVACGTGKDGAPSSSSSTGPVNLLSGFKSSAILGGGGMTLKGLTLPSSTSSPGLTTGGGGGLASGGGGMSLKGLSLSSGLNRAPPTSIGALPSCGGMSLKGFSLSSGLNTSSQFIPQSSVAPTILPLKGNICSYICMCLILMTIPLFFIFIGSTRTATATTCLTTAKTTGSAVFQFNVVPTATSVFKSSSPAQVSFTTATTKPSFSAKPFVFGGKAPLSRPYVSSKGSLGIKGLALSPIVKEEEKQKQQQIPVQSKSTSQAFQTGTGHKATPLSFLFTTQPGDSIPTGEENEKVMFCEKGKLFRSDSGQWKDRGVGEMKILFNKSTGKWRCVMRRDQTHIVCCNFLLVAGMSLNPYRQSNMKFTFSADDNFDGKSNFGLCFKTKEIAERFKEMFDRGCSQ